MDEGIKVTKTSKKQSMTKTIAMNDKAIKRTKLLWHKHARIHHVQRYIQRR